MTSTKLRIYDLAQVYTSNEEDQKVRKHRQSEITKQIISICESLGLQAKSSQSSIDENYLSKIVSRLQEEGLPLTADEVNNELRKHLAEKKQKGTKEQLKEQVQPEQPIKKQIKIVRRIKPTPPPEEKPPEVAEAPQDVKPAILPPVISIRKEPEKVLGEKPKPVIQHKPQEGIKGPSISIPLQPFRVAKPTMIPSMMGRTKRPGPRGTIIQRERIKKEEQKIITLERPTQVVITSPLAVQELSSKLFLPDTEVIKQLFAKGIIRTVNQTIEVDVAIDLAKSLGYEVITEVKEEERSLQPDISTELEEELMPRPPVVTIMGHVDHGKTTLLDAIRETKFKITEQEAGGITQHIGAYQVEVLDYDGNKRKITFLDTPGHEAFTAMRARGAQVTDIAVLVVAADDGVMPQTIEAINHARAAGVPIIVALNKVDKEGAQPDRVLGQLAEHDLLIEDYGGKTVCSKISAKKRINLDDLLTKITLVVDAELSRKLRANPNRFASGAVIEAQLSKEKGPIAHLLVQNGTLRKADFIVAHTVAGRVRALFDDHGHEIEEAPPSMPVEVMGLPTVPRAGDTFLVCKTYQKAKEIAQERQLQEKGMRRPSYGLVDFSSKVKLGQVHELKVIIKADVTGTAEAVVKEITGLSTKDVLLRPIHVGSGNITESDINLARSTNSIVIGFHVSIESNVQKLATDEGVDVRFYEVIYKITEDLEKAILGLLEPEKVELKLGAVEIRKIFTFGKGNKIAGCYVTEGKVQRNQIAKVKRNGKIVFEGKIDSLKRFKDDAREVQAGFECGIAFDNFQEVEEGDLIECWTIIEKERTSLT